MEAVIEGIKLYRAYKEEQGKEEGIRKGQDKVDVSGKGERGRGREKERRRHHGHEHGHEHEHEHEHRRKHCSKPRHRGHDHETLNRCISPSRRTHGDDEFHDRHHNRSRSKPQDRKHQSHRLNRDYDRNTSNPFNDDIQYEMARGTGPVHASDDQRSGTDPLPASGASGYQTSWRDLELPQSSRSQSREGDKRAATPHPARRLHQGSREDLPRGPDGTLFGSLPKYKAKAGLALGFGDHVLNTYRHIKAEHRAGHRARGYVEKKMDEARGRRGETVEEATGGYERRRLGRTRATNNGREKRPEETKKSADRDKEGSRRVGEWKQRKLCDRGQSIPEIRIQPPMNTERPRREPVPVRSGRSPSTQAIKLDEHEAPVEPPPRELSPSARSVNPDGHQSPAESPFPYTSPPLPPPPPPPPPAKSPLTLLKHASMDALLGDIQSGFRLRKVADSEKKDASVNPKGGRAVYDETPHSRDVEERERAQLAEESTAGSVNAEADEPPNPNQAFQDDLMKALTRRSSRQVTQHECATELRRGSDDSSLTTLSRTSIMVNVSQHLQDQSMLYMLKLRCA